MPETATEIDGGASEPAAAWPAPGDHEALQRAADARLDAWSGFVSELGKRLDEEFAGRARLVAVNRGEAETEILGTAVTVSWAPHGPNPRVFGVVVPPSRRGVVRTDEDGRLPPAKWALLLERLRELAEAGANRAPSPDEEAAEGEIDVALATAAREGFLRVEAPAPDPANGLDREYCRSILQMGRAWRAARA